MRGRWNGYWRETWSTVCSSVPHSQATKEVLPHLCKQERKRPTPVWRRLSRTQAMFGRVTPRVGAIVRDENAESCGVVRPFRIPLVVRPVCRTYVVAARWTDELLCVGTNGCLYFRYCASALDGWMSSEWNRCPCSMARRARDSVAPLGRSWAGWIPARIGRLFASIGRRYPVTIREASWMVGSIRRVRALQHQTGVQNSAVECTRARVAVCRVVAPAPQLAPESCLRSATRDVSFLRSDSKCRRYVRDLSNVTSRQLIFSSRLASLLLR